MRIAVIGMGNVGSVLGRRWAETPHEITFCVRDPDNPEKRAEAEQVKAAIGPVRDAAKAEAGEDACSTMIGCLRVPPMA